MLNGGGGYQIRRDLGGVHKGRIVQLRGARDRFAWWWSGKLLPNMVKV